MSSFKRRVPSKQVTLPSGTRPSPIATATVLTSSGIPSLDDILGGGLPLSCSLAVLAPDTHSAYGELVQKYFIAQGIACSHKVCIVHEDALSIAKECMWMPISSPSSPMPATPVEEDDEAVQSEDKIKIAWRYDQMKKFQTTVTLSNQSSADHYCDTFDLTSRIPASVVHDARSAERLVLLDLADAMNGVIRRIKDILSATPSTQVVRLCIVALGSPDWGDHSPADILQFLYTLRRLLRQYPQACACVTISPNLCTDLWAGSGWIQKAGWMADASISVSAFGANPALTALFPSHHGLVQIHKLPAPHSIIPASDKYSVLRGLSSSAAASIGTGENNLAFRCMRKRLIFETMHLDVEGGVAERRTTPSSTAINMDVVQAHVSDKGEVDGSLATIEMELEKTSIHDKGRPSEEVVPSQALISESGVDKRTSQRPKKPKKKVAFHSDKPDLYDF